MIKKQVVYIAGPMTGMNQWNYPAFDAAEIELIKLGYRVINPASHHNRRTDLDRTVYIRSAIKSVLKADVLALLPGWSKSMGALLEVSVAQQTGIVCYELSCVLSDHFDVDRCEVWLDEDGSYISGSCNPTGSDEKLAVKGDPRVGVHGVGFGPEPEVRERAHSSMKVCPPWADPKDGFPEYTPPVENATCQDLIKEGCKCGCGECTDDCTCPGDVPNGKLCDCDCERAESENVYRRTDCFPSSEPDKSKRRVALETAIELVDGDRNKDYGDPIDDFSRTAGVLNALNFSGPEGPLQPHDIPIMMMAVKLSRLAESPHHIDSLLDIAGYAACGVEVARQEEE